MNLIITKVCVVWDKLFALNVRLLNSQCQIQIVFGYQKSSEPARRLKPIFDIKSSIDFVYVLWIPKGYFVVEMHVLHVGMKSFWQISKIRCMASRKFQGQITW